MFIRVLSSTQATTGIQRGDIIFVREDDDDVTVVQHLVGARSNDKRALTVPDPKQSGVSCSRREGEL